jgi:hypothetical protein
MSKYVLSFLTFQTMINFLLQGQQYVCAGELLALETLTNVLNYLKVQKVDTSAVRVYMDCWHFSILTSLQARCKDGRREGQRDAWPSSRRELCQGSGEAKGRRPH